MSGLGNFIKLFKKKRQLIKEIILLKTAFSIIDQMFHKEIRDGENKRNQIFCGFFKNKQEKLQKYLFITTVWQDTS